MCALTNIIRCEREHTPKGIRDDWQPESHFHNARPIILFFLLCSRGVGSERQGTGRGDPHGIISRPKVQNAGDNAAACAMPLPEDEAPRRLRRTGGELLRLGVTWPVYDLVKQEVSQSSVRCRFTKHDALIDDE